MLVIGLGAVGSYVAGVLRAMGSRVVATKRTLAEKEKQASMIRFKIESFLNHRIQIQSNPPNG